MNKAIIPLANGCEEMEAVIIIDTLRRARWEVTSLGIAGPIVTASRGVKLIADAEWKDIKAFDYDILVLPGGRDGVRALIDDVRVLELVRSYMSKDKYVAAVCAAPLVLQAAGVLAGRKVTCHPGLKNELTATQRLSDRVVVDKKLVTSQGPGTCFDFALTLIRLVDGATAADAVAAGLIL